MIRYGYNQQVEPSAPFVHLTLRCREAGKEMANLAAQLNSAADRTVIPSQLVDELGLVLLDELPVSGFGGQVFLIPSYRVELAIRDQQPVVIEVLAHPEESVILLGRDILHRHRIVLNGPRLALEID